MIHTTTDYDIFTMMQTNRDVDLTPKETKNLADSMRQHGWLPAFPMMVKEYGGKFIIIDGQHRCAIARQHGIPVNYVVDNRDINVAKLNSTSRKWKPLDYAQTHAKSGLADYEELLDFYYSNKMPFTMCASILAGTTHFANVSDRFYNGAYKIKNRKVAFSLAGCYKDLTNAAPQLQKLCCVKALWMAFFVGYFDPARLVNSAVKRSATIKRPSNVDSCLDIFEEIYNHGRQDRRPLSFDAKKVSMDRKDTFGKGW